MLPARGSGARHNASGYVVGVDGSGTEAQDRPREREAVVHRISDRAQGSHLDVFDPATDLRDEPPWSARVPPSSSSVTVTCLSPLR